MENEVSDSGVRLKKEKVVMSKRNKVGLVLLATSAFLLVACGESQEPTKASSSLYTSDVRRATTSNALSKADLAWHAQNTYGWDCSEVISKGEINSDGYFLIKCTSGKVFRVYLRSGRHPKITNEIGGYN